MAATLHGSRYYVILPSRVNTKVLRLVAYAMHLKRYLVLIYFTRNTTSYGITALVKVKVLGLPLFILWKKFLKLFIPMFQLSLVNISSSLSSSSSKFVLKRTPKLNLKKSAYGTCPAFTAARVWGLLPSAKVKNMKMLSLISVPNMERTESKMYRWVWVNLGKEDVATNPTASNWSIPCGLSVLKNLFICSLISLSLAGPPVSPNPGVSMIVKV